MLPGQPLEGKSCSGVCTPDWAAHGTVSEERKGGINHTLDFNLKLAPYSFSLSTLCSSPSFHIKKN